MEAKFDFNDFVKQMRLLKNMGSLGGVLKLIPGMGKISGADLAKGENQLKRTESMINSMTKDEKANPELLSQSPSRRRRVAKGSGFMEKDVTKLVTDFTKMRSMMQNMGRGMPGMGGGMPGMGMPGMGGGMPGMGMPGMGEYPTEARRKKPKKKKKGFGSL